MLEQLNNTNYKILIVDDITANIELLSNLLELSGFDVSYVKNGKNAIQKVEKEPPDLILLDITMPGMSGFEVCRHFKDHLHTKDIPIIFITALSDTENIVKGFKVGGQDYITKPFNHQELMARVQMHIELKEKKAQINAYAQKLLKLNDQLNLQKEIIEQKNKDLMSSINYAQQIQHSLLPSTQTLKKYFNDACIVFLPKDIVSGDFFYYNKIDNRIIVIAADCTGHGVPGSMLTMLGTTIINNIVYHNKVTNPTEILEQLNQEFINLLYSNTHSDEKTPDGMDIALCCFDTENYDLCYSAGKRPLYILPKNADAISVHKAGFHSIGGFYDEDKVFTKYNCKLKKGDRIYIFTDGYTDQFGGPKNKKYSSRKLKNKFLELKNKTLSEQEKLLKQEFIDWKGNQEQIDDVLIIGFEI